MILHVILIECNYPISLLHMIYFCSICVHIAQNLHLKTDFCFKLALTHKMHVIVYSLLIYIYTCKYIIFILKINIFATQCTINGTCHWHEKQDCSSLSLHFAFFLLLPQQQSNVFVVTVNCLDQPSTNQQSQHYPITA